MPELPEVETMVCQLQKSLANRKILKAKIIDHKIIDPRLPALFPATVKEIRRRGKAIIIELQPKYYLYIHLRMTGHFHHLRTSTLEKYTAAVFYLDDGSLLTYNEIRRFGFIKVMTERQLEQELAKLGPEPLSVPEKEFLSLLQKKPASPIKTVLMDQMVITGIGNIYAQEICYYARVRPQRRIRSLSSAELHRLYLAMESVLRKAIKYCGTTIQNYSHLEGSGGFQKFLTVYQQERCPKNHTLKQIKQGGRGTSYCPTCQR
ncbi:bifunctional DNA-formamidopyrimidine glycosylase/DNA-(apurinic or apyrimidinic site) lyase [Candidatus Woesearchaeota archaeon]|nr:bifunctional DNA-formamidopyrimidine glycosylase/DNA-(apurinic or apyrimidinic site) lyase [Candidatus Woesearchaeota archaeon]